MSKKTSSFFLGFLIFVLVLIGFYNIPWVHDRLAWRIENWQTQLYYFLNPPSQIVFLPTQQGQVTLL
ncbi:MAG: hypothetical protein N2049_00590, partial [Anaerolineales bacterium]|nr:hypothetical protein [Anaerolineales bacterium]